MINHHRRQIWNLFVGVNPKDDTMQKNLSMPLTLCLSLPAFSPVNKSPAFCLSWWFTACYHCESERMITPLVYSSTNILLITSAATSIIFHWVYKYPWVGKTFSSYGEKQPATALCQLFSTELGIKNMSPSRQSWSEKGSRK